VRQLPAAAQGSSFWANLGEETPTLLLDSDDERPGGITAGRSVRRPGVAEEDGQRPSR
jgi:hypothetical protein